MSAMTVVELLARGGKELELECLTQPNGRQPITTVDLNRPGLVFVGFLENFMWERILIFGQTEILYLKRLAPEALREALSFPLQFDLPCVMITSHLEPPPLLLEIARERSIPILRTRLDTSNLVHRLTAFLEESFAPVTSVHATLVDVYGVGLLISGRSAIGKSECALDLVERGHRLVADDVVTIKRKASVLIGAGNELLRHCMEIRGIGIIDVQSIFGIRAIRAQKRVEVEVNLQEWNKETDYERVGLTDRTTKILDLEIPLVIVPIFPGKNITVIVETIALNYLVKAYGYDPARHFNEHLLEMMRRKANLQVLARDDLE
ncbi:MAG: HPr(Ser) kinase/phosphatase [Candidatus Eisenbacteria bacterium]|nr:HPr(Ser) kinase/phosphatase [Candidatus Eisenbacteria bacterium]MCC7140674.1 HPr(Ser) kinase/phosphatase [Candidatus Eisenbacteria bacterium]